MLKFAECKLIRVRIKSELRFLCTECNEAYKSKQYCPFCFMFYFQGGGLNEEAEAVDDKRWVQCDNNEPKNCERWVHIDCEELHIQEKLSSDAKHLRYFCPDCRDRLAAKKNPKFKKKLKPQGEVINREKWAKFCKKIIGRTDISLGNTAGNHPNFISSAAEQNQADPQDDSNYEQTSAMPGFALRNDATSSGRRPIIAARFSTHETVSALDLLLNSYGKSHS